MKILDIQQNTPEWEELRRSKIGASDCPIIMKKSPFKKPFTLWEEKVLGKKGHTSRAMQHGHDTEDEARRYISELHGKEYVSIVAQNDDVEWMIASLDGYCDGSLIEIKCPGDKAWEDFVQGKIPEHYLWQVQHQLAVTDLDKCTLIAFKADSRQKVIETTIHRDESMIVDLIKEEEVFWKSMITFNPPESGEEDFEIRKDGDWVDAASAWIKAKKDLEEAEELEKICREGLLFLSGDKSCKGGGIRVSKIFAKGAVDYSKIEALKSIDLEPYRKPSTMRWRVVAS